MCRNRVHLKKQPKTGRYTGRGKKSYEFTQLHINNTLHHWPLQGHFLNHATDLWFTNRQLWLKTTKTELPLYPDRKVFIKFYFTVSRRMTQKCTKHRYVFTDKMTQSARLYVAVCTFNDRGVFMFQAGGEQDGKGIYDWHSTKDKHKPVKSGANYSCLIYSLAAITQSISLFGHKQRTVLTSGPAKAWAVTLSHFLTWSQNLKPLQRQLAEAAQSITAN